MANGSGIAEGEDFLALNFKRRTNVGLCTNAQLKPFSPAFGKPVLPAVVVIRFSLCFQYFC